MTNEINFEDIRQRVLEKLTTSNDDELTKTIAYIATSIAVQVVSEYHQEVNESKAQHHPTV